MQEFEAHKDEPGIEVKYCEDTRPSHQLEASSKQHETLCRRLKAKKATLHTILLGVGGPFYTSNTLHYLKELGLDSQRILKTAKTKCSQGLNLEQGAASHPSYSH